MDIHSFVFVALSKHGFVFLMANTYNIYRIIEVLLQLMKMLYF